MCSRLTSRFWTPLTTLLITLALSVGGAARAQVANNCSNYADGNKGAYCLNGSDTWFDVMTKAIKNKVAEDRAANCQVSPLPPTCVAPAILQPAGDPSPGQSALYYNGTGSGNAANSMKAGAPGGGGALTGGGLGTQSIGPMSRNFRPNESCRSACSGNSVNAGQLCTAAAGCGGLAPGKTGTVTCDSAPNCGTQLIGQFPSWQPQIPNVGGLDAATIITKNQNQRFTNFSLPLLATDSTKANPNNTALTCNFGSVGGGTNCYDELLQVILSGVDGSGSTAACADPKRVQAISDFSAAFPNVLRHLYRRDDNSGTTDTFKDKINVQRFCNGAAVGVLGANKAHPNLNNQDLDPIRRPCDNSITNVRQAVTCTDLSTGALCDSNAATCTQGFITAISELDPGISDFSVTIANRAGSDATGLTVGYAGRTGIDNPSLGGTTAGPFINTNPPTDSLVRQDVYLLARRLFIQRGPALPSLDATVTAGTTVRANATGGTCATPPCTERITDANTTSNTLLCPDQDPGGNKCTGGGTKQRNFEDALFLWMTDTGGLGSQEGAPGRCNVDPIMKEFGFLTCTDDCTQPPSGSSNLCSKTPFPTIPSTPGACVPTAGQWTYAAVTCNAGQICCSTGLACPGSGTCPAATGRPLNSACSVPGAAAECAAGTTCTDLGGGLLACQ